jgi:hypothetical protein
VQTSPVQTGTAKPTPANSQLSSPQASNAGADRFAEDQASFNRWLNRRLAELQRIYVADALTEDMLNLVRSRRDEAMKPQPEHGSPEAG